MFDAEDLFFDCELVDFEPEDFFFESSPIPTTFAPASIAPVTAPLAAPLRTSVIVSVATVTIPLTALFAFFAGAAAFLAGAVLFAGDDLAVDFEPVFAVLLAVDDFDPEADDLPAAVFEPVDLLAEAFGVEAEDLAELVLAEGFAADLSVAVDDLLAVDLEAVFDELLAEVDFATVFEPEDLPARAAFVIAGFLVVVVDFVVLLVAIFFSLKMF